MKMRKQDGEYYKNEHKNVEVFKDHFWKSKTTAIYTVYILIQENEYFSYYIEFKYVGTIFMSSVKDYDDIQWQINQAFNVFATMKHVLSNSISIPAKLQFWLYNTSTVIAVNMLL